MDKEKKKEGWLHVRTIIEILGRPADYIDKVLELVIQQIGKEKGIELLEKKTYPAKPLEKVFSCFAEIEMLIHNLRTLSHFVFTYMPASVEILEPEEIKFSLQDVNNLLNDLAIRLHQYDALSKQLKFEKEVLIHKLQKQSEKTNEKMKK